MRNRYVRKNEIEKTEFLTDKFIHLINKQEVHFLFRKKRIVTITGLIVNHPMEKNKPWTVVKQIKFETNGWFDQGFLFPKTIDNKTINFYSISDEELEDLEDYKIKYPPTFVSPHTKNLIKSVNTEDSFTYDLEYIDKHEDVKVKQSQNSNQQNKKWKAFFLYVLIILLFVVLPMYLNSNDVTGINGITSTKNKTTTTTKNPIAEKYFSRKIYWADNYGGKRSKLLKIKESAYRSSIRNRKDILYSASWETMANSVIRNDKNKLSEVFKMFDQIYNSENMSRSYFADIIVSFTQDIPYSIIDNSIDIYAPVEFLKKYKGDCDTRTIFLYTILKKYNYDVLILNSWVYKHSIIGINLPTSGNNYKYYNGKRYYTWETTNTGWKRGLINPSQKYMNNWFIALK